MSEGQPNARTTGPVAGQAVTEAHESVLRHPIHAAEREAKELHDTVVKGKSGLTPAVLVGAWITFLIPLVAIVVGVALGVAYLVTRGDGSGGIASVPALSTDELAALPTDNWITNFAPSAGLVPDFRSRSPELALTHWPLRTSETARDAGRPRHVDTQTMRIQQHEKHLGAFVANVAAALEVAQPANRAERA